VRSKPRFLNEPVSIAGAIRADAAASEALAARPYRLAAFQARPARVEAQADGDRFAGLFE
jgi:hypothetical protein